MSETSAADDQEPRVRVPVPSQEEGVRDQPGGPAQTIGKRKLSLEARKQSAQIEVSFLQIIIVNCFHRRTRVENHFNRLGFLIKL